MACGGVKERYFDESLSQSMECSICTELFTDPKQLLCGHTLCGECVGRLVSQQTGERSTGLGGGRRQNHSHKLINCPECRQQTAVPPNGLPTNYKLADLVRRFQQIQTVGGNSKGKIKQCQMCESRVAEEKVWHCVSCSKREGFEQNQLCSDCGMEHHSGHELLKISTHMVARKQKAMAKIRESADGTSERICTIDSLCLDMDDIKSNIKDGMRLKFEEPIKIIQEKIESLEICSTEELEQAVKEAADFALESDKAADVVEKSQRQCIKLLQSACAFVVHSNDSTGLVQQLVQNITFPPTLQLAPTSDEDEFPSIICDSVQSPMAKYIRNSAAPNSPLTYNDVDSPASSAEMFMVTDDRPLSARVRDQRRAKLAKLTKRKK